MTDWPSGLQASRLEAIGVDGASSLGTTITAPGSANTKGAWTELTASSPIDADGFILQLQTTQTGVRDYLVDVGVGAAGSEQVVLSNFLKMHGSVGDDAPVWAYIPIPIKAGQRVAARYQVTATTAIALNVILTLVAGGFYSSLRCGRATTYGANTADSGGTGVDTGAVAHTKGAWAEIDAAIANPFTSCLVCLGMRTNTAMSVANGLFDLGVGAAASEVVIAPDNWFRMTADEQIHPRWFWLPVSAKAGQRLVARAQSGTTDATDRLLDVVVIGFD